MPMLIIGGRRICITWYQCSSNQLSPSLDGRPPCRFNPLLHVFRRDQSILLMQSRLHLQGDALQRGAAAAARALLVFQGGDGLGLVDLVGGEVELVEESLMQGVRDVFLLCWRSSLGPDGVEVCHEEEGECYKRESEANQRYDPDRCVQRLQIWMRFNLSKTKYFNFSDWQMNSYGAFFICIDSIVNSKHFEIQKMWENFESHPWTRETVCHRAILADWRRAICLWSISMKECIHSGLKSFFTQPPAFLFLDDPKVTCLNTERRMILNNSECGSESGLNLLCKIIWFFEQFQKVKMGQPNLWERENKAKVLLPGHCQVHTWHCQIERHLWVLWPFYSVGSISWLWWAKWGTQNVPNRFSNPKTSHSVSNMTPLQWEETLQRPHMNTMLHQSGQTSGCSQDKITEKKVKMCFASQLKLSSVKFTKDIYIDRPMSTFNIGVSFNP